jgi:hypothetical protein
MHQPELFRFVFSTLLLLCATDAPSLINPRFTPVHLVEESDRIIQVELLDAVGHLVRMRAVKSLKGSDWSAGAELDLSQTAKEARLHFERALRSPDRTALVFISAEFGAAQNGLILVGTTWARIYSTEAHRWHVERIDPQMSGTWAGSSEMLARAVEYILSDPGAEIPVAFEGKWGRATKIEKCDAKVYGLLNVGRQNQPAILMLCESGDRLFGWDAKDGTLRDLTIAANLKSKSRHAILSDVNGDGHIDLISWDGESVSAWFQSKDGAFTQRTSEFKTDKCIGLVALPSGPQREENILVSTLDCFTVLRNGESTFVAHRTLGKTHNLKPGGNPTPPLAGDFTGDKIPDVVEGFANGLVLYPGQNSGGIGTGVTFTSPNSVGDCSAAFCGDYDGDGHLDFVVVGNARIAFWHNQGAGRFREVLEETGELTYITKPRAVGGSTCDFNNDGRQDLMICYADMAPQFFFNRGFRTFGFASSLTLESRDACSSLAAGQQAALLADLNGNSRQDLLLVNQNQELWLVLDGKYAR